MHPSGSFLPHTPPPQNPKPQIHKFNSSYILKITQVSNEFSRIDQRSWLREWELPCGGLEAQEGRLTPFSWVCLLGSGWGRGGEQGVPPSLYSDRDGTGGKLLGRAH